MNNRIAESRHIAHCGRRLPAVAAQTGRRLEDLSLHPLHPVPGHYCGSLVSAGAGDPSEMADAGMASRGYRDLALTFCPTKPLDSGQRNLRESSYSESSLFSFSKAAAGIRPVAGIAGED